MTEISSLCLASVAVQADLSFTWSQTPKTSFLVTRLIYNYDTFIFHQIIVVTTMDFRLCFCFGTVNISVFQS